MNIKTLTTYDVYNYGASLQAYALQTHLTQLGHVVEIINYQPEYLTRKYNYHWVNPESKMSRNALTRTIYRTLKFLQRQTTLGRKHKFDYFNHQVLQETPQVYYTYEELSANPPKADLYIVGSDQIWNVFYETGRDKAFYLDFVKQGRKASYAASFSYLDIDDDNLKRISKSLQTFSGVSVRESHGIPLLQKMGIQGTWVLDPVFLLDEEMWKKQMVSFDRKESYLLVYDFEGNESMKTFCINYARKHDLKIYAIVDTYPLRYADKNFKSAGPQEFLTLIYHCDAFVSNSFHGTVFSIIFNKPVFVFNRHRHKVNSRMESLLGLFGLSACLEPQDDYSFDWGKVNQIRLNERQKSIAYLQSILAV